jgi:O-antigen/teichoic acid export membrane protein
MNESDNLVDDITRINRQRTVINAIATYGQYTVSFVIRIFLQAYIIRTLGRNEYAIWPLVVTCMSIVDLIRVGIGSGAARFLAHALGREDLKEVEQITTSLFAALLVASVLYTVAIVFLSVYFEAIFDIPEGAEGIGPWAMLLAGLGGAVALPFGVFQGGLRAAQKFVILNSITVVFFVARLILILLAFTLALPSLIWIAGINLALAIGEDVVFFIVARKVVPWQRVKWSSFNWQVLKKVNSFSLMLLVSYIATLLYWKTDSIIINKLLEPSMLTGYSAVSNIILVCHRLTSLGISVLLPIATILHARSDLPRIGRLIFRINRNLVPFVLSLLFFLMLNGSEILSVYIGPEYSEYGILFAILGLGMMFSGIQNSASLVPQAFGKWFTVAIMSFIVAICNVLLSIYFVSSLGMGLKGVAAGTAIVTIVYKSCFWPWYATRLLKMSWWEYMKKSFFMPVYNSIPFIITSLLIYSCGIGRNLKELTAAMVVSGSVELMYMMVWGFDVNERSAVRKLISDLGSKVVFVVKQRRDAE